MTISLQTACAQNDSLPKQLCAAANISAKTIDDLQKKYTTLTSKLDRQSVKLLNQMQRKENKLCAALEASGNIKAQKLYSTDIWQQYQVLRSDLASTSSTTEPFPLKEYVPGLDSLQTTLSFLTRNAKLPPGKAKQLQSLQVKLKGLEEELQRANNIQSFINEREVLLKEQLSNTGWAKQLKGINKKVYYYHSQVNEYKELLNDRGKLKEKLLETVRSLPAFQKFWQKNSYLAALFPIPRNANTQEALTGLQTITNVQDIIAQRSGAVAGQNVSAQQYFQTQADIAQVQLNELKNRLNKFSNSSGNDMTIPDFKPNSQKTKSFFKRLEYGFNIQNETSRYSLPTLTDAALSVGYKLSDSKRAGIGASYKIGWGHDIRHLHITHEGVGLRSYLDIKAKGGLWLSGGFEYNYLSSFKSLHELYDNVDVWQRSVLVGLSRKYKVGKKERNIQLLYDFLHGLQTPPGTPLKFRIGWAF